MKILWFTWKDRKNPLAGGAEVVNEQLAKRLAADGHEVIFLVGGFEGFSQEEVVDGFKIIRVGGKWSVYFKACQYYKKHLKDWPDLVIDEVNTIPFFTKFYTKQKNILFVHQLCREIWFYQMFFPFSLVGYLIETLYL
ncbi:TPA: glycosyltransferase family 1 protein, partial [Candidatus Taylorbacteria bacterium]|nr:glycosyltransferase family 1 protein [Candidatus Taylorbacteria bacterium]